MSGPSLKRGAFRAATPAREKQMFLELKIIKKCIFFKTRVFSICPGRKSGTKYCIFLKRGYLERSFGLFVPIFSFIYETFLVISYLVFNVSYPSHFVPILVISYPGNFVPISKLGTK